MKNWEKKEYRRISNAILHGDKMIVQFEDGSEFEIATNQLVPDGVPKSEWLDISFSPHMIRASMASHALEIPWSSIRSLTDPEFSLHEEKRAQHQVESVGARIRKLREYRGLTSKELAERAGISPQSLSRIENGRHDVVFATLQRILGAMGCSLRDLAETDESQAATDRKFQHGIWTRSEPVSGVYRVDDQVEASAAMTRKSAVAVFEEGEKTTPSNTPSSNTPSTSKARAA